MEAKLGTVAKLVGDDHDTLNRMDEVQRELVESTRATATASIRLAELAEVKEKRESEAAEKAEAALVEQRRAEREAGARRWRWFEDNWKVMLLALLLLAGVNLDPILRYFGAAPTQAVTVAQPVQVAPPAPAESSE